ncbi:MAG: lamin tail domain-containing protein [Bacteroidota bacterium]
MAQISSFPYTESFDTVAVPVLPAGWATTTNRLPAGDFATTTSTSRSAPNCLISTNSTITQTLVSPTFNFTSRSPNQLQFYTARSSTHTAGLLLEVSTDNGATFPIQLADTVRNPGVTGYVLTTIQLPVSLINQATVKFRWRLTGGSGGTAGTFRIDDVSLSVLTSYDLSIIRLFASPPSPAAIDSIVLTAAVKNLGQQTASGYSIVFFRDANGNQIFEASEQFGNVGGNPIPTSDSASFSALHSALPSGNHRFFASVSYPQDENNANDTLSLTVGVASLKGALVVNEIMFDPLANQNEWIELLNRSSSPIDLSDWKFSDRPTTSGANMFTITSQSRIVQPGDFVVIAAESSILQLYSNLQSAGSNIHVFILNRSGGLSLGNESDDIILKDLTGKAIDSVSYTPTWHHPDVTDTKGRSLERINPNLDTNDPRNWSTATGFLGGSPGGSNTIFTRTLSVSASLSISPNPFSPDGDSFEDFCSISYDLPSSTSLIHLRIYDIRGRLIRTLANAEFSGAKGSLIWDGLDNGKQRARIGPYVVLIEALDSQGGAVHSAKSVVVVATKL